MKKAAITIARKGFIVLRPTLKILSLIPVNNVKNKARPVAGNLIEKAVICQKCLV